MIASDDNNPNFTGAKNPDNVLHVVFYTKPVKNDFKTDLEKRPIFENVDFVKITPPGNVLNVVDTPVREDHKARFPRQWQMYKNRTGDIAGVVGTPITEWARITPAMAEELKALKFYTVESVALASDGQLQGIGMIAGQSIFSFRDDAKRFLSMAEVDSMASEAARKLKEAEDRIAAKDREMAEKLEAMQLDMSAKMEKMMEQMQQQMMANAAPKAKRGRKPKEVAA